MNNLIQTRYNPVKTQRKSIVFRERTFRIVHAAVVTQGPEAAAILNHRYGGAPALAAGGKGTDYHGVFGDLGHELVETKGQMTDANNAHLGQLAVVVDLQKRRNVLTHGLFGRFYKSRHTLESLFGKQRGFEVLAVDGETPRDPAGLITQVRSTVTFLEEPKVALPPVGVDGIAVDLQALAFHLRRGADELEAVLTGIEREQKNAQTTRLAKNAAIAEFDNRYLWIGRALETYFHLAGMHELAELVRPSARRPGRRAADEDLDPEEAEAAEAQATEVEADTETEVVEEAEADAETGETPGSE